MLLTSSSILFAVGQKQIPLVLHEETETPSSQHGAGDGQDHIEQKCRETNQCKHGKHRPGADDPAGPPGTSWPVQVPCRFPSIPAQAGARHNRRGIPVHQPARRWEPQRRYLRPHRLQASPPEAVCAGNISAPKANNSQQIMSLPLAKLVFQNASRRSFPSPKGPVQPLQFPAIAPSSR